MRGRFSSGAIIALAMTGMGSGSALLYDTGIVGVTKKPNHVFIEPGCFCHGDLPSAATHAWIEGPDSLGAGEAAVFTMHVAKDSSIAAGFNVAAFFGSLGIVDSAATQRMEPEPGDSAEITHVMPRPADGRDTISWPFLYQAPMTAGIVDTLYANGNSVNLSDDPEGDHWAFAPNCLVTILPHSGVSDPLPVAAHRLLQNYPNPFNPSTTIAYELERSAVVDLAIFDMTGRRLTVLAHGREEAGSHAVTFDISALSVDGVVSSGIYLYRLSVVPGDTRQDPAYVEAGKMVVLK